MHLCRSIAATAAGAAVIIAASSLGTGAYAATAKPVAQGAAQGLNGSLGGQDLANLAGVPTTSAKNYGGSAVSVGGPVDPRLIRSIDVPLRTVLSGLSSAPGLTIGALNQHAAAANNGTAGGSAQIANAGLNLGTLTGGASNALGSLSLGVGAVTGTASQASGVHGAQRGSCDIASLDLNLGSAAVGQIFSQLTSALAPLNGIANTLENLDLGGLVAVTANGVQTPSQLLASLSSVSLLNGSVTASLESGTVHIDLAGALRALGVDLCTAPNTDVLAQLAATLKTALPQAISHLVTELATKATGSLQLCGGSVTTDCYAVTVAGLPVTVPASLTTLTDALSSAGSQLSTALAPISSGLGSVFGDFDTALQGLVSIVTNKQASSDGTFTETALAVAVGSALPSLDDASSIRLAAVQAIDPSAAAVQLNLGVATVGPGLGAAAPTGASTSTSAGAASTAATAGSAAAIKVDAGSADPHHGVSALLIGVLLVALGGGGYLTLRLRKAQH